MPEPSPLVNLCDDIHKNVIQLIDEGDVDPLAVVYASVKGVAADLSVILRDIENAFEHLLGTGTYHVPSSDLAVIVTQTSVRKGWDSEELLKTLLDKAFGPPSQNLPTIEDLGNLKEMLTDCLPLTGSLAWHVKGLTKYGIDPDEFSGKRPGPVKVAVVDGRSIPNTNPNKPRRKPIS